MQKMRLDLLLMERGMAESRAKAQALILAGEVRVAGQMVDRASATIPLDAEVMLASKPRFVSRGGEKLEAALDAFQVNVSDRTCADVGASTGGFTDCLLQHGASRVYTIDVGKGILHWKIRSDERVAVMEETNARYVTSLPEPVSLVTIDASFISLKILLPVVRNWFGPAAASKANDVIALIKPQFEAGRQVMAKNDGVVRDPQVHRQVLKGVLTFAENDTFTVLGLIKSPLIGPKGNIEFLAWFGIGEATRLDVDALIRNVLNE